MSDLERLLREHGPQPAQYADEYERDAAKRRVTNTPPPLLNEESQMDESPRERPEDRGDLIRGPQRLRCFGPVPEGHELLGKPCFGCLAEIKSGHYVTFILIGPGIDPQKRIAAREGREYEGVAIACHFSCATGIESDEEVADQVRRYVMQIPHEPKRARKPRIVATHLTDQAGDVSKLKLPGRD